MAACLRSLGGSGPEHPTGPEHRTGLAALASSTVAAVLGVTGIGASVALRRVDRGPTLAWGDDPVSRRLSDLQFTLGEGPAIDASEHGLAVFAPDLGDVSASRWSAFTAEAIGLGVRAVFALPLQIGAIRAGALVMHRLTAGPLSPTALKDAQAFADAVTSTILSAEAGTQLTVGDLVDQQMIVFQATGMISIQLAVDLAEALARLRAHAYGANKTVSEVAADVVARRLRFDRLR